MVKKDIEIRTYKDFYERCNELFEDSIEDSVVYHYIVDAASRNLRDIVLLYQSLRNKDFYPGISKRITMTIKISTKMDLEPFFLGTFCEYSEDGNWTIKKIYDNIDFYYDFDYADMLNQRKVMAWFEMYNNLRNEKKYHGVAERISTVQTISERKVVYILIFNDEDYSAFLQFVDNDIDGWDIKEEYRDREFIFLIGYSSEYVSPNLLHNFLLFYNHIERMKGMRVYINIPTQDRELIDDAKAIMQTYLLDTKGIKFFINNEKASWTMKGVGKLLPATYIKDDEELAFFSKPVQEWVWNRVIEFDENDKEKKYVITQSTFKDEPLERKYWAYLRICQKYLLDTYDDIESKPYEKLRREAYRSNTFYSKYICRMPFLAVFLFSLYDGFYRRDMLIEMKEATTAYKKSRGESEKEKWNENLTRNDILLSEQYKQDWCKYSIYEEKKKECDVKNLLLKSNGKEVEFHKTIEAEIFESISIAEGLLQIIENAVLHARGALLSMRVYNRAKGVNTREFKKPEHVSYLDKIYSNSYFESLNSKFYLEVQVSDLSKTSIPIKFCENLKRDTETWSQLERYYKDLNRNLEEVIKKIEIDYFFRNSLGDELVEFKNVFYKMNRNLVHHYGLEIFNAIITARKGIFSVVSHNSGYDNIFEILGKSKIQQFSENEMLMKNEQAKRVEDIARTIRRKVQGNKQISGTAYRMILPLNHTVVKDAPAINNGIIIKENIEEIKEPIEVDLDMLLCNLGSEKGVQGKQKKIDIIASNIKKVYREQREKEREQKKRESGDDNKVDILCVNLYGNNASDTDFEVIVKGILLFGLNTIDDTGHLAIAIVNLTPFQLVEATRIISVYYSKSSVDSERNAFKHMPIYLKCFASCKEVVFEGDNEREVREAIIKNAILSGTMFDELQTIIDILKKVDKRKEVAQDGR